ncbi:MAG: hypothetical protein NTW30_04420, partial [Candidatus Aenigmarchaeota archaeon]|nr:hypothetical protein [Candidatus Aenigmarchaeota archaeon]
MDEINLLSAVVLAIATTVLAGATIYYAILNRRLLLNMERQLMKPCKDEEIKHIIKPLLKQCEIETNHLNEKRYMWFTKGLTLTGIFYSDNPKRIVFNAFLQEKPKIKERIEEHDKLIGELKNKFKSFFDFINTRKFRSRIANLIIEFDKEKGKINQKVDEGTINFYVNSIVDCIIKNVDLNDNILSGELASFWKIYGT